MIIRQGRLGLAHFRGPDAPGEQIHSF